MGDIHVYYHRETETMPRADLEALQLDKLRELLNVGKKVTYLFYMS